MAPLRRAMSRLRPRRRNIVICAGVFYQMSSDFDNETLSVRSHISLSESLVGMPNMSA
jgi:hypothetical protein